MGTTYVMIEVIGRSQVDFTTLGKWVDICMKYLYLQKGTEFPYIQH